MEFSKKPVASITASTSGYIAHQSLLGTLLIIESRITDDTQFVVSAVKTKVNTNNVITDEATLTKTMRMIRALIEMVNGTTAEDDYLPAPILMNG